MDFSTMVEVSQLFDADDDKLQSINAELDKQIAADSEEIFTTPDIPTKPPAEEMDEEEDNFRKMNEELDKQIAQDFVAIQKYIRNTKNDSFSNRIAFFNKIDNSHIDKCVDRNVSNHILFQHTILGTIKWHECTQCEYRAREKSKLVEHMATHTRILTSFECPKCTYMLQSKEELKRHLEIVHGEKNCQIYSCDKCGQNFNKYFELLRHNKEVHNAAAFPCEKCDFVSTDQNELRQHVLGEHLKLNVSWYKCAKCSYRTVKKVNLDRHIMYKHSMF